jgi:2-methylcitrate dehydratase PrpD
MTIASELAVRVAATRFEDLSPMALLYAKMGLLDTFGVGVAGASEEAAVIARKVMAGASGPAVVWGMQSRVAPLDAAFLNGIAANVLDFDDCTHNMGGHPSAPLLPALLALAESRGASGRDVLTAYVAGFEVQTQIGRGVNFHHYEKGWHATATLGVFGAGAGCARLLGLDAQKTQHALALCIASSGGAKSNLGSMAKPMHVGQSARGGLLSALLAAEGFTAQPDAFEHSQGFFELYNGAGNYSAEKILEKWGEPWDIEMPGIAIKQYPCCLSAQSAIDATLRLVREHNIKADQIEAVHSRTSARRLHHTNRPEPRSALDSKLSIQYVLARAVIDRGVTLDHFSGDNWESPEVRQMMARVSATEFSADADRSDMGADVTLVLKNGERKEGTIDLPVGHDHGQPLDGELLNEKFMACARGPLGTAQAERLHDAVNGIETLADIRELMKLLQPVSPAPAH